MMIDSNNRTMINHSRRTNLLFLLLLACICLTSFLAQAQDENVEAPSPSTSDAPTNSNKGSNDDNNNDKHRSRGPAPVLSPENFGDDGSRPSVDGGGGSKGKNSRPSLTPVKPLDNDGEGGASPSSNADNGASPHVVDSGTASDSKELRHDKKYINKVLKSHQNFVTVDFAREIQQLVDAGRLDEIPDFIEAMNQQMRYNRKHTATPTAENLDAATTKKKIVQEIAADLKKKLQQIHDDVAEIMNSNPYLFGTKEFTEDADAAAELLEKATADYAAIKAIADDAAASHDEKAAGAAKMRDKYERRARSSSQKIHTQAEATASSSKPSSQPSSNSYQYQYEQTYNSIFQPSLEEYDLLKFDPYSLSGAPLGGWGRATRSRLAGLPIRLVSDFEGGVDLWYGNGDGDSEGESVVEGSESLEEEREEQANGNDGSTSSIPNDIPRSTGPHFSIHDATGQKYICRMYAEDELIVLSRLDSVFHPAITVGDAAKFENAEQQGTGEQTKEILLQEDLQEEEKEEVHIKKKFHLTIQNKDGTDQLPEGIRSDVAKILNQMGMTDAAQAIVDQHPPFADGGFEGDIEVDVVVADTEALEDGNGIAEIIKAAAVGSGMDSNSATKKENGKSDGSGNKQLSTTNTMPAQLTSEEIYTLLTKLTGLCSQLHLGWWSYEWCHEEQLRQFHIAVSNDPDVSGSGRGDRPKYEIQDVTSVGNFKEEVQVIYPKGNYGGVYKAGTTQTIKYDARGNVLRAQTTAHTPKDDEKYGLHMPPKGANLTPKQKQAMKKLPFSHGGPIIQQIFDSGDFCEEVNYNRHVYVELRCCTVEEIDNWMGSKKQASSSGGKKTTPLAVLVGVHEESTCIYRARVCTPLLCPKPVEVLTTTDSSSSSSDGGTKSTTTKTSTTNEQNAKSKVDPIGALLNAIFGDEFVEQYGQVQVFFPDDVIGKEFDELIREAENGGDFVNHPSFARVKKALRKSRGGGSSKQLNVKDLLEDANAAGGGVSGKASGVMEVKDGMSIREILGMTLGKRPCLLKNYGWWTYEFCHGKNVRQYHSNNLVDANTGFSKQKIESEHLLGMYENSGNSVENYPHKDEHFHVVNATSSGPTNADLVIGRRKGPQNNGGGSGGGMPKNEKQPGGNGAVYIQEYDHGDVCDHEDVAESAIKGGNVVHGAVERSSTVRFSCGKRLELIDIKEDSTCHYILDVTVPELCQHELFKAAVTKTQVVKCLPV
mmetsp:Transcript_1421/g.2734  ORF Transcript_1421/g.2734 Transcript_1421/m.2734 type:complete len:1222 (-) Transcript_1421:137-3802(-)